MERFYLAHADNAIWRQAVAKIKEGDTFYLNLLNDRECGPEDNPSIGIILCAEKDDVEIEYALKTKQNPIGVAEYQLLSKLPAEMKGKLPTARQLAGAVRTALPGKRGKGS